MELMSSGGDAHRRRQDAHTGRPGPEGLQHGASGAADRGW